MILYHKHKFIFIHIGKTGGTSIEKVLCEELNIPFEETKKTPKTGNWWKHEWSMEMRNYVGYENWDEYFKFAFIRNPWDRQVSKYEFYMQKVYYQTDASPVNAELAKRFRELPAKQFLMNIINHQNKFICEDDSVAVDFMGKFETLYDDMKQIVNIIVPGLPDSCWSLPHKNKTKRKNYREYYDEESKQKIQEVCKKDIELGNYTF